MAQESTKAIPSSFYSGPGPLLPKETLPATSIPKHSGPHRWDWKQYIRNRISKSSVEVFIASAVVVGLLFFLATLSNSRASNDLTEGTLAMPEDYVVLSGEIPKLDWQNAKVVSVQWFVFGMGRYKLQLPDLPPGSNIPPNVAMDIYIDNASQPVFSYNPAEVLLLTYLGVEGLTSLPSLYSFRTECKALRCDHRHHAPHDCYTLSASGFAIDKETNNSIPLFFGLNNSGAGDFDAVSILLRRSTNFTRIVDGQLTTTEVDSFKSFSNITRSKRARALTYFLFTINWLLALCSVFITALSFRERGEEKYRVALIPVVFALAIPTIRSLYPGAPPLGVVIDLVGFFPQMLSVGCCVAVTLSGFAARHDNKGVFRQMGPLHP